MGAIERAARDLIGIPFKLHGRDRGTGLDCVGVVAEVVRATGRQPVVPEGYSLRNAGVSHFLKFASANTLMPTDHSGHIVLCMVNPIQPHLLVRVSGGFVHAHAGLRRVTFMPDPLPWPITMQWNLDVSEQTPKQDRNS